MQITTLEIVEEGELRYIEGDHIDFDLDEIAILKAFHAGHTVKVTRERSGKLQIDRLD